ncbi:hypothetical protein Daesc_005556 [Daldinia eschscholtzii]|uniref:Rhodopsin domain-containing protein n=1 Tax=Daldinia eschscholtzii TaxID=292717 RepID=A0AAX6MKT7_9PEZI
MSQNSTIPDSILLGPALKPPPGQTPNFTNPSNLNEIAHFTNAICLLLTIIVGLIRVYAKVFSAKKLEIEDVLALAGMAAILIEWNRIFVPRGVQNSFYWVGKGLLVFISLGHIAYIVAENMSCIPYPKIWDKTILEGYCINSKIFQIPGSAINSICISVIIVLSQRAIWRLQLTMRKKLGISFLFLIGLLALASSLARAVTMVKWIDSDDKVYTINSVYLWSLAENTCCFLAIGAPWVPAAFSNRGSLRSAINTLMLYTRLSGKKSRGDAKSHSWPSQRAPTRNENWDLGTVYNEAKDAAALPLVKYPSNSSKNGQSGNGGLPREGILMTTEIVVATDSVDEGSLTRYPWRSG